ncbi:unnamed protein product [marine sediment metagenome]|uniref:Uncharacterized protein n=1 Tax=marine sediment metagenome TaxID=412755 RepID=X1GGB0_9ZZZZ
MKPWEIVVSDKIEPQLRKKVKRLLKPVLSVAGSPAKCELCGTDTTWTVNNRRVCPACNVQYGFTPGYVIPDACEVCGKQGEWCTDGEPIHSLCYIHRDVWFRWKNPELEFIDHKKQPEKWHQAWEEGWAKFIAFMKETASV